MTVDVLYLCHGRLEFTMATLPTLLRNTDWDEVNDFVVYNDRAPDHPDTYDYLRSLPQSFSLRETNLGSPVAVMNHFLARTKASMFAKIDNDIVVPPGWLGDLLDVMERNPELELLGMEPGMSGFAPSDAGMGEVVHGYLPASNIGGVGLMRCSAFRNRPTLVPDGRFGFTEWQHEHEPVRGWIQPDLMLFALDLLPIEPWRSITDSYRRTPDLQRAWPKYHLGMSWAWQWWLDLEDV